MPIYPKSTAPSIQVLGLTEQRRSQLANQRPVTGDEVLLVGNPTLPEGLRLPNLLGAEEVVDEVARLYPNAQPLKGSAATETIVKQRMATARLIHLATHGLLETVGESGIPGAIALAPDDQNDGLLTPAEILPLSLQAELVVLSACDTGLGTLTGDGVVGLARSFFQAGVASVMVSLWAVPDAPTAELMAEFYRQLLRGQVKAQALRRAMLTTRQSYPNPEDWAAFSLVGAAE
jgi:CHAT domain-containing protein